MSVPRLAILALAIATVSRLLEAHLGFPRAVNWLHFPIVGLAFALSLGRLYDSAPSLLAANLALLGAFIVGASINGAGAINAALGFALLAEPFLLYTALVAANPPASSIRTLGRWLLALAVVQIPPCPAVLPAVRPDRVQGTFPGMGTGHHVMGAIALTGALYLNRSFTPQPAWLGWVLSGLLLALPVLSDAKQVMLAFLGPGHGVSRLGGWLLETYWSVLEPLGATRTGIAAEAWAANAREGPASSLFAPLFSWAGIFGDIGIAGLAAYGWLLWLVYRRSADDFSRLLVLAVVALGFCFDWLEQYNFMLYALAVLAERSLAGSGRPPLRLPAAQSIEP